MFIPANMTSHFQPLDLTINGIARKLFKDTFDEWYAAQVQKQLGDGSNTYAVEVKLSLSVLKPINGRWIIYTIICETKEKRSSKDLIRLVSAKQSHCLNWRK